MGFRVKALGYVGFIDIGKTPIDIRLRPQQRVTTKLMHPLHGRFSIKRNGVGSGFRVWGDVGCIGWAVYKTPNLTRKGLH